MKFKVVVTKIINLKILIKFQLTFWGYVMCFVDLDVFGYSHYYILLGKID